MTEPERGDEEGAVSYATLLLRDAREELDRADTKASIVLGATGIATGALLGGILGGDWTPADLTTTAQIAWWVGTATGACALVLLAAAVYPRTAHPNKHHGVAYFGHAAAFESTHELEAAVKRAAHAPLQRAVDQLWHVSRIARTKHTLIRWAFRMLAAATALLAVAPVLDTAV